MNSTMEGIVDGNKHDLTKNAQKIGKDERTDHELTTSRTTVNDDDISIEFSHCIIVVRYLCRFLILRLVFL